VSSGFRYKVIVYDFMMIFIFMGRTRIYKSNAERQNSYYWNHHEEQKRKQKEYWELHREERNTYQRNKLKKISLWLMEYKSHLKCELCPESHPATLDFHHKNPKEKDVNIARLVSDRKSIDYIKSEIDKCRVLCSNCHRKLHWEETSQASI
jgi:hypothetical protein